MSRHLGGLVLYGDKRMNSALADELALDGYQVHQATHPETLSTRCKGGEVDLVIFGQSPHRGLDALRALRAGQLAPGAVGIRVLWMGARREPSVLRAFEAGADDVTRASVSHAEMLARVRALLSRPSSRVSESPAVIVYGPLEIDTAARTATVESTPVDLRRLEFALLVHLARDPVRVYTKHELLRAIWGYPADSTRTVDSHVSRLRRKLARAGAEGWVSVSWGIGWRLAPDRPFG